MQLRYNLVVIYHYKVDISVLYINYKYKWNKIILRYRNERIKWIITLWGRSKRVRKKLLSF